MGWFHLTQLLVNESVAVHAVVEPWFLGAGAGKPGSEAFAELRGANPKVTFCAAVDEVTAVTAGSPLLFLIAGRTSDAPKLFEQCLKQGASHIYIEKPGGENAAQLRRMRDAAAEHNVSIVVGYNKNVAEYARDAIASLRSRLEAAKPLPQVTLEHCNDFAPGEPLLSFLRGPGAEGMLHNMCCHELALACTLFGVQASRVTSIVLDAASSELVELGKGLSDWSRVRFTLLLDAETATLPAGAVPLTQITFSADRTRASLDAAHALPCPAPKPTPSGDLTPDLPLLGRAGCGGNFSRILLSEADAAAKPAVFRLPSTAREEVIQKEQLADPEIRPYFLQQAPDYERLKDMYIEHILQGEPGIPEGVVGIEGAINALELADMLVPAIKQCWADGKPWTKQSLPAAD